MKKCTNVLFAVSCILLATVYMGFANDGSTVRSYDGEPAVGTAAISLPMMASGACDTLRNLGAIPAFPTASFGHASVAMGDTIYIAGGSATGAASTTFVTYCVSTGIWGTGAPLPEAKTGGDLVAAGGSLYYIGGGSAITVATATCYKYTPATGWSAIASIPTAVTGNVAESWGDSVIFCVAGGWTTYLTAVQVYRPGSNTWSTSTALPAGRGRRSFAGGLHGNKFFVSCGFSGAFRRDFLIGTIVRADSISWATSTDVPIRTGAVGLSRPGGTAVDGRYYVVAGETTPAPTQCDSVFVWNIATAQWLPPIRGRGTTAASNYWGAITSTTIGGNVKVWIPGGALTGQTGNPLWVIDVCSSAPPAAPNRALLLPTPGVNTNYVQVPFQAGMVGFGNNITIEAWVKIGGSTTANTILNKGAASFDYQLGINATTMFPFFRAGGTVVIDSFANLSVGTWAHLAVTYDGSTVRFYKDGSVHLTRAIALTLGSSTNEMRIGRGNADAGSGNIDELRLWSVARTAGQIDSTKCKKYPGSFSSTVGLKALWHFDSTYVDSVSGFNGTPLGGAGFELVNNCITVSVAENQPEVPADFRLAQNYPNPFNPTTTIQYGLPTAANVTLKIYNILGQEVATLVDGFSNAGTFEAVWNGHNSFGNQVASGMYFYSLVAKSPDSKTTFTNIKKMLLVK